MTDTKPSDLLALAFEVHASGDYDKALELYETILKENASESYAHHGIGLIFAARGDYKRAIHYFTEAINLFPTIPEFHNNIGNAYKMVGQLSPSKRHFSEALKLKPRYPEAHNNLGALFYREGNFTEASYHFNKAINLYPEYVDAHYNLGICCTQLNQIQDALGHFKEAIKIVPHHLGALHNLGIALVTIGDLQGAQEPLETLVSLEPNNLQALFHLGIVYGSLNLEEKAIEVYQKVLTLSPDHAYAHHNLATLYLNRKEKELALLHYEKTLALMPENETASHMIDALKGRIPKEGAPLSYIKSLFDQYAYTYDEHMQDTLKFNVPSLIREMLTPYSINGLFLRGLDLGCGTGLMAPYLSDITGELIGVDISEHMIQKAKVRGGYFKLYVDDIVTFLELNPLPFDLIVASDVFVYFGQLESIFNKISKNLNENGIFCFSIEECINADLISKQSSNLASNSAPQSQPEPFQLQLSGRFCHQLSYIEQLAQEMGLRVVTTKNCQLREQDGQGIQGQIVVIKKQTSH